MQDLSNINTKVQDALGKLFQQYRLIFWYDAKEELRDLFANLQMPDVEKIVIENNEFTIKHRLLIEQPTQRFLLYRAKEKPADNENWLLDLLLSNYEFQTETSSLYLQDLGLPQEFKPLIKQHEEFCLDAKRLNELKALIEPEDRESSIRLKMLSVICSCEPEWEKVLYALFAEIQKSKQDKYKTIHKFNLSAFLWETIEKKYNYKSANSTIKDFLLTLIQDNFERSILTGKAVLNKDAYLLVNRWKENTKARQIFSDWSLQLEKDLGIETTIQNHQAEELLDADTYSAIDKLIILTVMEHISKNTLPNHQIQEWIEKRKVKFFFDKFTQIYQALSNAAYLFDEIRKMNLEIENPQDGFEKYQKQWYKIDRLYRNYIFASEQAEHQNTLKDLTLQIEKAYSNSYLLKLSDNWQAVIDNMPNWNIDKVLTQKQFYLNWIAPYIRTSNKVFVIISDALRYESAVEFKEFILQQNEYTATLSAVLGSLPSYTQLGMAALLPHTSLTYEDQSETVFADGISTQGTPNRTKILQMKHPGSIAISAEDFLKINSKLEGREFSKTYNVVYIYSNHIDKTGDDKTSEGKAFEATESEFQNLWKIIKHIFNMNVSNMIITSDHGYIYQHNRLDESDFTDFNPIGKIYKSSRRFVIGKELIANASVKKWQGAAIGLDDETELLIPKSINRIRIQGAGSRFVHGGATFQEIVLPVLEINKARKKNIIEFVDIDIIGGSANITSNTFAVSFYQKQPIADKIQSRQIKAGFYTKDDQLISDVVTILFNSSEADAKAREKKQSFQFTAEASKFNGQDVYLKLNEQVDGTNQFTAFKTGIYRMLIAFSSAFDDF